MDTLRELLKTRPLPFMAVAMGMGTLLPCPWSGLETLLSVTGSCLLVSVVTGGLLRVLGMGTALLIAGMVIAVPQAPLPPAFPTPPGETLPFTAVAHGAPLRTQRGWKLEKVEVRAPGASGPLIATLFGEGSPPDIGPGDHIHGWSRFRQREASRNPGARPLPSKSAKWILSLSVGRPWAVESRGKGIRPLDALRVELNSTIDGHLSPDSRELTLALALGESGALPTHLRDLFAATGTSHLLAISGLHLALLAGALAWLLQTALLRLPRPGQCGGPWFLAAIGTGTMAIAYTFFTHHRVATIRACVMLSTVLLARMARRKIHGPSALGAAGIFLLLLDPHVVESPGFQLSFVAVAGLLWADRIQSTRGVLHLLWACVVAWSATAPLAAIYFDRVVWGAPLINGLAVPFVSLVLLPACLLIPAISSVVPALGPSLMYALDWLNLHFISLLDTTRPIGYATWIPGHFSLPWCLCLAAVFIVLKPSVFCRRSRILALLTIVFCVGIQFLRMPPETLTVSFLDVGHGDAIVIQNPEGDIMVVDGGGRPGDGGRTGRQAILPALRDARALKVDVLVLTHPDADHMEGLLPVVARYPVDRFWWNGDIAPSASQIRLLSALVAGGTRLQELPTRPTYFRWGGVQIETLRAEDDGKGDLTRNDRSIVLRLTLGAHSFLLTGDIESKAEAQLIPQLQHTQVVKAPHHGSATSSSPEFIHSTRPDHVVISASRNHRYNLPNPEIVKRYKTINAQIHRTDRDGAISFVTDGKRLWWRKFGG